MGHISSLFYYCRVNKLKHWTNSPKKKWCTMGNSPFPQLSNDTSIIFQNWGMHFIHLNKNSLLPKIDEIHYIVKLTNATVIGLSETKHDNIILSSELKIEGYVWTGKIWPIPKRRKCNLFCLKLNFVYHFCINTESIFIEISLPKSIPFLTGISGRSPDEYDFVNCIERTFSDTIVFESQECYLHGDIDTNLQPKNKEIFSHKSTNTIDKEIPHITRSCLEFSFTHSPKQIITRPTRVTNQSATLIDYIRTHPPGKVIQSGVIVFQIMTWFTAQEDIPTQLL